MAEDGAEAKHSINSGGSNKRRQLGKAKPKALPKRDIASTQEEQADDDRRTAKAKRIINSGRPNRPPKQSILSKGSISGRDGVPRRIGVCVWCVDNEARSHSNRKSRTMLARCLRMAWNSVSAEEVAYILRQQEVSTLNQS